MFVNIVKFPPIKEGKDREFREWFNWSTGKFARHEGFVSRRLFTPREGGNYVAIVEHESFETFMAMHTSDDQAEARKRVVSLLSGDPEPHFYETVLD